VKIRVPHRAFGRSARGPLDACGLTLVTLCCVPALLCCGGHTGPPRHPVAEMSARVTGRIGVIDLVVSDPARADRLRQVYLQIAELAIEYDLARAHSILQARSLAQTRSAEAAPAEGSDADVLEHLLAPPLEQGKAMFERYTALTLESRSLLTEDEFETLNRVR
jgi:hypothetical protein